MSKISACEITDEDADSDELNIQEITSVTQGTKLAQTLLRNTDCITMTFRRGLCASRDTLVLVAITPYAQSTCYLWDLHRRPHLVIEGGFARIMQAVEIIKIVHDGYRELHELYKNYGIHWHSIFDTYLAFQGLLIDAQLPRRKISVKQLYTKLSPLLPIHECKRKRLLGVIFEELDMANLTWTQRPFKFKMTLNLATFTLALEQCFCVLRHLYSPFFNYSDYINIYLFEERLHHWWCQHRSDKVCQLHDELATNGVTLAEHCQPLAKGAPYFK